MITWKDNITEFVKRIQQTELNFKKTKLEVLKELTSIAFKTQVDMYVKDGSKKGNEYLPISEGDISRFTRRKTLSTKPYFSSKFIFSRSGDIKNDLLNASDAAKGDLKYSDDNVGFEISQDSVKVFATSDKFAKLERAKSGKGSKSQRQTTKKTWQRVIKLFGKTFKKFFQTK